MKYLFTLLALGAVTLSIAQHKVNWETSVRKVNDAVYELRFVAKTQPGWHIYSLTSPEGGPQATIFRFNKNPFVRLTGSVKEVGKLITKYEEVFELDVKYFEGNAEFVQTVSLKGKVKTNLTGSIEYMVCDDTQCLPPTTYPFTFQLP